MLPASRRSMVTPVRNTIVTDFPHFKTCKSLSILRERDCRDSFSGNDWVCSQGSISRPMMYCRFAWVCCTETTEPVGTFFARSEVWRGLVLGCSWLYEWCDESLAVGGRFEMDVNEEWSSFSGGWGGREKSLSHRPD
jgi:hypothetical protein